MLDNGEDIDDYVIGRDLGLTISRVRALKERKELKYHKDNMMKTLLQNLILRTQLRSTMN